MKAVALDKYAVAGGLGTGKLEFTEDCQLKNLTIAKNWWNPIPSADFKIAVHVKSSRGDKTAALLSHEHLVEFDDLYPCAKLVYDIGGLMLDLQILSLLVPGDAFVSSLPACILSLKMKNTLSEVITFSAALLLENIIGSSSVGRVNRVVKQVSLKGVLMGRMHEDYAEERVNGDITVATVNENFTYIGTVDPSREDPIGEFLDTGRLPDLDLRRIVENENEKLAAAIGASTTLKPGAEDELVFILAWHFAGKPELFYENYFSSSWDVANFVARNYTSLRKLVTLWQKKILKNCISQRIARALLYSLKSIPACTIFRKDGALLFIDNPPCGEGVEPVESRPIYSLFTKLFFPEVDGKTLALIARYQSDKGRIPRDLGKKNELFPRMSPKPAEAICEPSCAFIIDLYAYALLTGDTSLTDLLYPSALKAYEWLITLDRNRDHLPDICTPLFSDSQPDPNKLILFYTTALQALNKISQLLGDLATLRYTSNRLKRIKRHLSENDVKVTRANLMGIWCSEVLGLGNILPFEEKARLLKESIEHSSCTWEKIMACSCLIPLDYEKTELLEKLLEENLWRDELIGLETKTVECCTPRALVVWAIPLLLAGLKVDFARGEITATPRKPIKVVLPLLGSLFEFEFEIENRCLIYVFRCERTLSIKKIRIAKPPWENYKVQVTVNSVDLSDAVKTEATEDSILIDIGALTGETVLRVCHDYS